MWIKCYSQLAYPQEALMYLRKIKQCYNENVWTWRNTTLCKFKLLSFFHCPLWFLKNNLKIYVKFCDIGKYSISFTSPHDYSILLLRICKHCYISNTSWICITSNFMSLNGISTVTKEKFQIAWLLCSSSQKGKREF